MTSHPEDKVLPLASCAHMRVTYRTREEGVGHVVESWWECAEGCGMKFWPRAAHEPSEDTTTQVRPPMRSWTWAEPTEQLDELRELRERYIELLRSDPEPLSMDDVLRWVRSEITRAAEEAYRRGIKDGRDDMARALQKRSER